MSELAALRGQGRVVGTFFSFAFIGAGGAAILGGWVLSLAGWRVALAVAGLPCVLGAALLHWPGYWADTDRTGLGATTSRSAKTSNGMSAFLIAGAIVAVVLQMAWPRAIGVPAAVAVSLVVALIWAMRLRRLSPESFAATLERPPFNWWLVAFAALFFADYAAWFWLIPYAQRTFPNTPAANDALLGGLSIVGGIAGMILGGVVADLWRRLSVAGAAWTALVAALCEGVAIVLASQAHQESTFLLVYGGFNLVSGAWTGLAAAIGLELVQPAHRGTGTALYFLVTTLCGAALSPYLVGVWADQHGMVAALELASLSCVLAAAGLLRLVMLLLAASPPTRGTPVTTR